MLGVWKFLLSGILLQKDLSRLERIGTRRDAQETTKILESVFKEFRWFWQTRYVLYRL
jgi:hypothetical protein